MKILSIAFIGMALVMPRRRRGEGRLACRAAGQCGPVLRPLPEPIAGDWNLRRRCHIEGGLPSRTNERFPFPVTSTAGLSNILSMLSTKPSSTSGTRGITCSIKSRASASATRIETEKTTSSTPSAMASPSLSEITKGFRVLGSWLHTPAASEGRIGHPPRTSGRGAGSYGHAGWVLLAGAGLYEPVGHRAQNHRRQLEQTALLWPARRRAGALTSSRLPSAGRVIRPARGVGIEPHRHVAAAKPPSPPRARALFRLSSVG